MTPRSNAHPRRIPCLLLAITAIAIACGGSRQPPASGGHAGAVVAGSGGGGTGGGSGSGAGGSGGAAGGMAGSGTGGAGGGGAGGSAAGGDGGSAGGGGSGGLADGARVEAVIGPDGGELVLRSGEIRVVIEPLQLGSPRTFALQEIPGQGLRSWSVEPSGERVRADVFLRFPEAELGVVRGTDPAFFDLTVHRHALAFETGGEPSFVPIALRLEEGDVIVSGRLEQLGRIHLLPAGPGSDDRVRWRLAQEPGPFSMPFELEVTFSVTDQQELARFGDQCLTERGYVASVQATGSMPPLTTSSGSMAQNPGGGPAAGQSVTLRPVLQCEGSGPATVRVSLDASLSPTLHGCGDMSSVKLPQGADDGWILEGPVRCGP